MSIKIRFTLQVQTLQHYLTLWSSVVDSRYNYDNVLRRLVVDERECFYGLQPAGAAAAASFDQDPPIFACRFSEAPGYEHILALANEDGKVAIQVWIRFNFFLISKALQNVSEELIKIDFDQLTRIYGPTFCVVV